MHFACNAMSQSDSHVPLKFICVAGTYYVVFFTFALTRLSKRHLRPLVALQCLGNLCSLLAVRGLSLPVGFSFTHFFPFRNLFGVNFIFCLCFFFFFYFHLRWNVVLSCSCCYSSSIRKTEFTIIECPLRGDEEPVILWMAFFFFVCQVRFYNLLICITIDRIKRNCFCAR